MIEFKNITKTFGSQSGPVSALSAVSFSVPAGSVYGVIGASGAGKSTLLRCVNLLERPTGGQVSVNGQDMARLTAAELRAARRKMGMIFQGFNLLGSRTVYDNIALPLRLAGSAPATIDKKVLSLIELVGLVDRQHHYPAQLSGGQKQRVAIARALASEPDILLCDEATSALDPKSTQSILNLLRTINQKLNLTILLITHEMSVVQALCDRVAIMSGGKVVEESDVESFFIRPRTALAREFVGAAVHEKPLQELVAVSARDHTGQRLIKIRFVDQSVVQPLVTTAARRFEVDFNILQADIQTVHGKTMGFMTVEMVGEQAKMDDVLRFFKTNKVHVEATGDDS